MRQQRILSSRRSGAGTQSSSMPLARWRRTQVALAVATAAVVILASLTFMPDTVLPITTAHAAATTISCPYGWSLLEAGSSSPPTAAAAAADAESHTRQCLRVFATPAVAANAAEAACRSIFTSSSVAAAPLSEDGVTPWPFARDVAPHGAAVLSDADNAFVQRLFLRLFDGAVDDDDTLLVLGGVAGYGQVDWYGAPATANPAIVTTTQRIAQLTQRAAAAAFVAADDVVDVRGTRTVTAAADDAAVYTNFADDVDWTLHAGTIVMRSSGAWELLPASSGSTALPFVCAFDASAAATTPESSSHGAGQSSSSSSSSSSSLTSSSSTETQPPLPTYDRAHRPPVPQPAPACLDGWTALPSTVDSSDGAANTVCYRLYHTPAEVGGRLGKTFEQAQAHCSAQHPKATLASVMSQQENEWLASTVLAPLRTSVATSGGGGTCLCSTSAAKAASSSAAARTVFLGGSYMRDGTGAGLIGSWYADQFLFNATDYAATSPSSPAWPTARNTYYANWRQSEPRLSYGVVGLTAPAESCQCPPTLDISGNLTGTVVATAGGGWVGLDPRATQPFLCSYLNDGSTFPETTTSTTTTTASPDSNSAPAPGPSEMCLRGWSYLPLTNSCYRVYPIRSGDDDNGDAAAAVTPATMEETCEQVLRGRVVATKVNKARAVAMRSVAESNYVGSLLQHYLDDSANAAYITAPPASGAAPTNVSLAGISFIDKGDGGFYISGVSELNPELAYSLWAAAEPSNVKGCVAVDAAGLWYYVPCSSYTSDSMPDNAAVTVQAYTCQYRASDIDPRKDALSPQTSTTPEPTSGPDWSSESSGDSTADAWPPLTQRIASLSGATHLVVAAGSTGVYTLQGPTGGAPLAASVRGLHLYFAPLSAYYAFPTATTAVDGTALGSVFAASQAGPRSLSDLLVLSPNASAARPFAPCEGYKEQSRITRVRRNSVTVHHATTSEVGYVCVSQDGRTYVPTAMTYEVTEVTVDGFIPTAASAKVVEGTARPPTWLPPLFCNDTAGTPCAVQRTLAIAEHSTGTVQLALRRSSSSDSGDDSAVVMAQAPDTDTMVSHLRLSARADCMSDDVPFHLLTRDITVRQVASARYTRSGLSSPSADGQYSVFSYQYATIRAAQLSSLAPVYNSSASASALATLQPPVEYYVCVAVRKSDAAYLGNTTGSKAGEAAAASRRLLALWNVTASDVVGVSAAALDTAAGAAAEAGVLSTPPTSSSASSSSSLSEEAYLLSIATRLAARTSLGPDGAPLRTYTAVPNLKAHIIPAPVSVKGMWALPPRRLTQRAASTAAENDGGSAAADVGASMATLVPAPATFNRSAHYRLRPTYTYTYDAATPSSSLSRQQRRQVDAVDSVAHLHVPQYSSPIILLDGHHLQPGMLALLSQDPQSCNRLQPVPRSDPTTTAAGAELPAYLDTMVPVSTITMRVETNSSSSGGGGGGDGTTTATMAYFQLNLNHTGLYGHHPTRTDTAAATEQTWYVCLAYSPLSPFLPLRSPALAITVHRLRVDRFAMDASAAFTSSDAAAAAEAADASTTHLNLNTGFAGMLWLHGVDVRLWSTTTLHSAQVAFAVVMPSSGTPDETAAQCSHSNLFYSQQGLGLLTEASQAQQRSSSSGKYEEAEEEEEVETSVGMVIPLGFFSRQSTRRMQLCLSVPLPFSTLSPPASDPSSAAVPAAAVPQHRVFAPVVNTTLDVRPIQVLYMGRYSAIPTTPTGVSASNAASAAAAGGSDGGLGTGGTVIRLAEGVRDVVLPLAGYGIRPDMTMFLSRQLCHGVPAGATQTDTTRLVATQSLLNISVVSLYDLPSAYWNDDGEDDGDENAGQAHRPRVFVVLRHADLLRKAAATALFRETIVVDPLTGAVTTQRVPLNVCLYAPGTATLVFPTNFQLVVDPPRVVAIRNAPSDADLLRRAAVSMPAGAMATVSAAAATVVYAANMDLVVEGFGLDDANAWLIPAVSCDNASSFLWRAPVQLSALPSSKTTAVRMAGAASGGGGGTSSSSSSFSSSATTLFADSSRYVDPQTSFSSWYATLRQQETVRFGSDDNASSGQVVQRFQWCVRIIEHDATTATGAAAAADTTTEGSSSGTGYVSTGIPYQLILPAVRGFALDNARSGSPPSTVLALPTQHPTKGRWFSMRLVGAMVDVVDAVGSPLYMFLAPEMYSCHEVKNAYLGQGLYAFGNASFTAVNGSAVLLPRWLSSAGSYRLCGSAVYPTLASADAGIEAALQFFTLDGLRVQLTQAVYGVFALNHTTTVTVEQGQEWTLPISGSMLTNRSVIRFHTTADRCGEPMRATKKAGGALLPDIPIQNDFSGFRLFGEDDESSELEGGTSVLVNGYYVVLSQSLIRALAAPQSYVLCLQPQHGLAWRVAPSVTLNVVKHVRRPTHYNYFPDDGSEDVVALTALAPTKVALEWNTGETSMANVVGAAGQQVSLAMWCLPTPQGGNSSGAASSSRPDGVEEELVPCGDHRRVMFVKPLDNDDDPCFVDAEAVSDDVMRGPYVLDFGVLTLPHALSVVDGSSSGVSTMVPNMTQPWILCLETGPERWREPTSPMFQLQYTRAIPTGFRLSPDDASNTTAPFPAHKTTVEAMTAAEVDSATSMPIGGNTTLYLFAQDSSQVVYLNGYGIERGHQLRFGHRCEENMAAPNSSSSSSSSSDDSSAAATAAAEASAEAMSAYLAAVAQRQSLANPRLYAEPLLIEDDNGVFLVPGTHIEVAEAVLAGTRGIPMCLSTDGGVTYAATSLTLRVQPSRLQSDTETTYRNLLSTILSNTLLVPQMSRGSVDLSELMKATQDEPAADNNHNSTASSSSAGSSATIVQKTDSDSFDIDDDSTTVTTPTVYLRAGTQVLLSASCSINTHGLPLVTVNVPNILTLTTQHTAVATAQRLLMCFRRVQAAAEVAANATAAGEENEVGALTAAFQWYGLYYRVMAVQVTQVAQHSWTPTPALQADDVRHVVLRRGAEEDLLLPVLMTPQSTSNAPAPAAFSDNNDGQAEDALLQLIERSPSTLSLLSLTRLYVGRPCFRTNVAAAPATAVSPFVTSYAGMQLSFSAHSVAAEPLMVDQRGDASAAAQLNRTLVAALPGSTDAAVVPQFPLEARGSVCLSVDGGLHYLAVGIAQFTEDWAPTLRVTLDVEDREGGDGEGDTMGGTDDNDDDDGSSNGTISRDPLRATTNSMRVYAQGSTTRRLIDTRFVAPAQPVLSDLGQLTTMMLWSGFLGQDGFAMDGLLYLPASSTLTREGTQQPEPLPFSLDNRLQNIATDLTVTVVPWSLTCYGVAAELDLFVRQQDTGMFASTTPGLCSNGVRDGARVRVVPLSAARCDDPAEVDAAYVMDLLTVQPGSWGAATTAAASEAGFTASSPFRAMQLPMGLRYVPEGTYALCLRQDLPFVSSLQDDEKNNGDDDDDAAAAATHNRALYTAVYAATPLRLHVSYNWTIRSIGGVAADGEAVSTAIAVAQGSNVELGVTGTAVHVRGVPLLMALAPRSPRTVVRRVAGSTAQNATKEEEEEWLWSSGCAGVAEVWDPVTGTSLLVHDTAEGDSAAATTTTAAATAGAALSTPWFNAHHGAWTMEAAHTREVTWDIATGALAQFAVCYSVDGGLTFTAAGLSLESADSTAVPFTTVIVPPTITALSASRAASPGVEAPQQLQWSADSATATATRVQHLFTTSAADAAITADANPLVTAYTRVDGANTTAAYATRPTGYTYGWTGAFVGNGVGGTSGRALSASPAPSPSARAAEDVPTVAAAVALVRTSLYGARCDGLHAVSATFSAYNASDESAWANATPASPLATPIFLVSLQHGGVWSDSDAAAVAAWRAAEGVNSTRAAMFDRMNAVLGRGDWVASTIALWEQNSTTPLTGPALLGRATTAALAEARSNGESLLVCLSVDGAHFYSADVGRAAQMSAEPTAVTAAAAGASGAASLLATWPLYLRAKVNDTVAGGVAEAAEETTTAAVVVRAPLWMRETAMVVELLARPSANSSASTVSLNINAATLMRFQSALAAQLGVDAAVVVVQLAQSGTVTLPVGNVTTTTTTTTTTAPPPTAAPTEALSSATATRSSNGVADAVLRCAVEAVQARHGAQASAKLAEDGDVAASAAGTESSQEEVQEEQQMQLPTYALAVTIIADAAAYNSTADTSTLTATPDLLYRAVEALRHNVTGPALLRALAADTTSTTTATTTDGAVAPPLTLYALTVNFTLSNGVDLHTANATMADALPTAPAQEVRWRNQLLSVPYTVVLPDTVPDADDNDPSSKVSWWVVPVLLILPALMGYGTYYVYKKYLKKAPDAAPATEVTVENAH